MDGVQFEGLKAAVRADLSVEQCLDLQRVVAAVLSARKGEVALARRREAIEQAMTCPHCAADGVVKHGRDKAGRQRYRCVAAACGKTFNVLTGTPFARMRKPEKWAEFARLMRNPTLSLKDIVESGIGIARLTAWRWRHRFMQVPEALQSAQLSGVIEVDETYFRSSYKGSRGWKKGKPPENRPPRYRGEKASKRGLSGELVPVVTALDRSGGLVEGVLKTRTAADIAKILDGRIAPRSVVCSDGNRAYVKIAVQNKSEHRRIHIPLKADPATAYIRKAKGGKPRKKGRLGLGMVNGHHEQLKTAINRYLRGVSTKYLPRYLGWLRAVRRRANADDLLLQLGLTTPS